MPFKKALFFLSIFFFLFCGCTKYAKRAAQDTTTGSGTGGGTGSGTGGSGTGSGTGGSGTGSGGSGTGGTGSGTAGSGTSGTGPIIISYTFTSPCAPSTEKFTFTCSGSGVPSGSSFEWYFGDGNAGYTNPVENIYTEGGNKTVLVKVKKSGAVVGQQSVSIKAVGQDVSPVASFSYNLTNQVGTQATYEFQSNSYLAKGSMQYLWDFGDGTTGTGIKYTKTFTQIAADQTKVVKLKVTSDAGCSDTKSLNVIVPAAYDIKGGFTAVSTSPCLPSREVFTFTGPTTNVPAGAIYTWDFGDGSGLTLGNPVTKSYVNGNSYNVILTIVYNGKELYKVGQPIKTFGQEATPTPSFSIQFKGQTGNDYAYNFNNTSNISGGYANINWKWEFGDSTTFNGVVASIDKSFTRGPVDKDYYVKMTVTANSGCSAVAQASVFIPKL